MKCPRCANEISETETICPFCHQEINLNVEFNDFRKDGFIQIRAKEEAGAEPKNYTPKYFNFAEFNIFIVAIVFVLSVAAFTVFSLRFVQHNINPLAPTPAVPVYTFPPTQPYSAPPAPTEAPTYKNTLKSFSIKNICGSWRYREQVEIEGTAIPYYTFFSDGTVQQNQGSITHAGTYRDLSEDDKNTVYIMIEDVLEGVYDFTVEGNKRDGYILTLTSSSGRAYKLETAEAKAYDLTPMENYTVDEDLIGVWETEDGLKDYQFYDDGTLIRNTGYTTTNAVWTIDSDGDVTLKYMKDVIKTLKLQYKISADKTRLRINNVIYYKKEVPTNTKPTEKPTEPAETTEKSEAES